MSKAPSPFATVLSAIMLIGASMAPAATAQSPFAEEAQVIAQESYIYLYPLILMDLTRKQLTSVDPKVNEFGGPEACSKDHCPPGAAEMSANRLHRTDRASDKIEHPQLIMR